MYLRHVSLVVLALNELPSEESKINQLSGHYVFMEQVSAKTILTRLDRLGLIENLPWENCITYIISLPYRRRTTGPDGSACNNCYLSGGFNVVNHNQIYIEHVQRKRKEENEHQRRNSTRKEIK